MQLDGRRQDKEKINLANIDFEKQQETDFKERMKFGDNIGKILKGLTPLLLYLNVDLKEHLIHKAIKNHFGFAFMNLTNENGDKIFGNRMITKEIYVEKEQKDENLSEDSFIQRITKPKKNYTMGNICGGHNHANHRTKSPTKSQKLSSTKDLIIKPRDTTQISNRRTGIISSS